MNPPRNRLPQDVLRKNKCGYPLARCCVSGERGEPAGGAAALVAMLYSLSTRFAPGAEELRRGFRTRAYEEICNRDAPLFEHLSTLFPGKKREGRGVTVVHLFFIVSYITAVVGRTNSRPRSALEAFYQQSTGT